MGIKNDIPARTREIIRLLEQEFPEPKSALNFRNVFELLISVILSAQTTDVQVNKATPALFAKYPTPALLAKAKITDIENLIRTIGFYKMKAKNIQTTAKLLVENFDGKVPQKMEELLTLRGVGRKTANVVLEGGFGVVEGIVVDTHVDRISTKRLQIVPIKLRHKPEKIEQELMKIVPREKWGKFAHLLILHGRKTCHAIRPKCTLCPIVHLCPGREISLSKVGLNVEK